MGRELARPVTMGRVLGAYGVNGWIKVAPYTASVDALCGYPTWWIGRAGSWQESEVAETAVHGATVVAKLAGIDVRERAAELKGLEVAVPRAALPPPGEGEHYWSDLVGLSVENLQGEALGEISEMFSNGAHDIARIVQDGRERLVPFVEPVVREVSLEERRILVDWGADW